MRNLNFPSAPVGVVLWGVVPRRSWIVTPGRAAPVESPRKPAIVVPCGVARSRSGPSCGGGGGGGGGGALIQNHIWNRPGIARRVLRTVACG